MGFLKNRFDASPKNQSEPKIGWIQLTNLGQLNEIITESAENPVLLFKHSTRCSISRMVLRNFENEFNLEEKIRPYFLDLLLHRDISNAIAERFEVVHQSPQLIIIEKGKAIYNTSHENIDASQLKQFT